MKIIQQVELEANEDQHACHEEYRQLLHGINFDEELEEQQITNEYEELLEGINFDEVIECCDTPQNVCTQEDKEIQEVPILLPFTSDEPKSPIVHTFSNTSISPSEPFDVTEEPNFEMLFNDELFPTNVSRIVFF